MTQQNESEQEKKDRVAFEKFWVNVKHDTGAVQRLGTSYRFQDASKAWDFYRSIHQESNAKMQQMREDLRWALSWVERDSIQERKEEIKKKWQI